MPSSGITAFRGSIRLRRNDLDRSFSFLCRARIVQRPAAFEGLNCLPGLLPYSGATRVTSKPGEEKHMAANPHRERPSDEANRKQLAIAQREGAAYQEGLRVMATEVADVGGTQQAGDLYHRLCSRTCRRHVPPA